MAASKNPMVVAQVSTALGWPGIRGSTRSLPQPSSGGGYLGSAAALRAERP